MTKSHIVNVTIVNQTGQDLVYADDWFDSGRVADNNAWPATIANGNTAVVECYEKDWSLAGCSGWVKYTLAGTDVFFAFSNPVAGTNGIDFGAGTSIWDNMTGHYFPVSRAVWTGGGPQWITAYIESTGGDTNTAQYTVKMVDLSVITEANLTLDNVTSVFNSISPTTAYRKYFECGDDPTAINAFFQSHFKGLSVYHDKFIFSHTNIALPVAQNGTMIVADNLPGPGQAQTEGTFATLHPGWPHPCSSQACGSFMALGIQQSDSAPGSNVSEIEILDIRATAVNGTPRLLGVIPRPTIGVNGVGMTKEIGPDGKYLVAALNGDDLTFYRSQSSSLLVNEQPTVAFDEVMHITGFAESGAGLALVTQSDGTIFLIALNADDDATNNKACLYAYDDGPNPVLSPRLAELDLPVTSLSDSVQLAVEYAALLNPIIAALFLKYGSKIFNNAFRWGKGVAITSNNSIELYASDRNVMPLSSIPAIGSDKDFSVMVWQGSDSRTI